MGKKRTKGDTLPPQTLRQRAEAMLSTSRTEIAGLSAEDVQSLVHKLQVHQIELEIQNEEQRQAQIDLAESRDRFSDLYEFAPVGYLTLDRNGTIQQANMRAAGMLNVDRKNLVGAKFSEFVDCDGQEQWHLHWQAITGDAAPQTCELPLGATAGVQHWVRLESTGDQLGQDSSKLCRMALIDVSERRRSDKARYDAELRLRSFLNNSAVIAWMKDEEGRYVFASENYLNRFQLRLEDLRDKTDFDLWLPEFAERLRENDLAVLSEHRASEIIEEVPNPDGSRAWWLSNKFPFTDAHGRKCVGGLAIDVTQRVRAENALRELNDSLESQVAERTSALQMLSDVASMANQTADVEAAILYALKRVSQHHGWCFSHAWLPSQDDPEELLPGYAWYEESPPRFDSFRELLLRTRLRRGEGSVGRVFSGGSPEFATDAASESSIRGAPLAEHLGIQSVGAFPVLIGDEPAGVLEFFSDKRIEPTEQLLNCMASVGTLLGCVIERARAAQELNRSLERHRAVLNAALDAIVTIDRRGRIVGANPATEEMFGYNADEIMGQNVNLLMPSPYREEHDGYLARYLETREARIIGIGRELVARRRDGTEFPIELEINEVDHLDLFTGLIHDITERKLAERALRESEQRLELALAASELGLWDTNLLTGEMIIDERWAAMLGYTLDEIEPHTKSWERIVHPDDLTRIMRARSRHLEGRTASYQAEHRLRTKSGEWKWIRIRGRVTEKNEAGQPVRITGTHLDITRQKTLEREVVESAVEEQRRIGQELHDGIGGELTGVGFTVQALIEDLQSSAPTEVAMAEKIGREIDRVIQQVRLLSHGLNPVEVDRQGLTVALAMLASRTEQLHRIQCDFRVQGTVAVEDNFVADHLYRIAQEAVTNAVKHGNPQNIRVTLESNDRTLVLRVADDGIGVKERDVTVEGIGLRNMHYRAGLIGADLRIESSAEGGTLVRCRYTSERLA